MGQATLFLEGHLQMRLMRLMMSPVVEVAKRYTIINGYLVS
jgi:hypothetical protein